MPEQFSRRDLWRRLFSGPAPDYGQITHDRLRLTAPDAFFTHDDPGAVTPQVDTAAWTLLVDGFVARPLVLSDADILALPALEDVRVLVSAAGHLGMARFRGPRLRGLLAQAGIQPEATHALFLNASHQRATVPLARLDDALLAYALAGERLRPEHGFPLRALLPGLYDVPALRWLKHIRLVGDDDFGVAAPTEVGLHLRIDTPTSSLRVRQGAAVAVQGVAFAGTRRITAVDISVDGGGWMPATLRPPSPPRGWTQWYALWTPTTPGAVSIAARAVDDRGETASAALALHIA